MEKFSKKVTRSNFAGDRVFECNRTKQKFRKGTYDSCPGRSQSVLCMQHPSLSSVEAYYSKARSLVHKNILNPCTIAWDGVTRSVNVCYENGDDMQGLIDYCNKHAKELFSENGETLKLRRIIRESATGLCFIHSQNFCHGNVGLDSICISADGNVVKLHMLFDIKASPTVAEVQKDLCDFADSIERYINEKKKDISYLLQDYLKRLKSQSLNVEVNCYILDHPFYWDNERTCVFALMLHQNRNKVWRKLKKLRWQQDIPEQYLFRHDGTKYDQEDFIEFSTMLRGKVLHLQADGKSVVDYLDPKLLMSMLEIYEPATYEKFSI